MFLHLLPEAEQAQFLDIAWLFSISDNSLLWDGKTEAELTGETDLKKVSFQVIESEKAILENFSRECGKSRQHPDYTDFFGKIFNDSLKSGAEAKLINKLKSLPLAQQNDPAQRQQAASAVLAELVTGDGSSPTAHKIVLFELMLLCLADGVISETEGRLLKHFVELRQIDDCIYDDLLECAESMNRETSKTLALILE